MIYRPTLRLKRLIVSQNGKHVYDEVYHIGVNVIRGDNSSGKSTIADMIYYSLGGENPRWKAEAEKCDFVLAEFHFNQAKITLKREITDKGQQSLQCFWGDIEAALAASVDGWMIFPFRRSENKNSFSQTLFQALEMPEIRGDNESNITMHQILRLMYVDQLTAPDSLFRYERFDTPLQRETISMLLCGLYDDETYELQLKVSDLKKEKDALALQLSAINNVAKQSDVVIDRLSIDGKIFELKKERDELYIKLAKQKSDNATRIEDATELDNKRQNLVALRQELEKTRLQREGLLLDINDSVLFEKNLKDRVLALKDAILTQKSLSDVVFQYCPSCLSLIEKTSDSSCHLCKGTKESAVTQYNETSLKQMQLEIEIQIKETQSILNKKNNEFNSLNSTYKMLSEREESVGKWFDSNINQIRTKEDALRDETQREIGACDAQINEYINLSKMAAAHEELSLKKASIESELSSLNSKIQAALAQRERREGQIKSSVAEKILTLLKKDINREEAFENSQEVEIDFRKGIVSVDGRNQFSASSMIYLKNCFSFAMLWAATELSYMKFPRFLILDNIEDKGMEEVRSKNYQNVIVELSKTFKCEFQLIFTTSMVANEVNTSDYVVGDYYKEGNKSLKVT